MQRANPGYSLRDLNPEAGRFLDDVMSGLSRPEKALPPKYFYDAQGCALFEAICELPEYYLTRVELALMHAHAGEMARHIGPQCALIEYGSGSARKTRILIGAIVPVAYIPIDIARAELAATAAEIAREFPRVHVSAVCADYSRPLALPELEGLNARRRMGYFPGSTIGNFTPAEASAFLTIARDQVGPAGGLLVGVDLKKDPARLAAARVVEGGVEPGRVL